MKKGTWHNVEDEDDFGWTTEERPKCGYGFEYRYKFEVPAANGYSGVPGTWVAWLNRNVKRKYGWHFDDHIHNPDSLEGLGFYKQIGRAHV